MNPFIGAGDTAMLQNQLAQGQKPAPQMNYEEWKASSGQAGDRGYNNYLNSIPAPAPPPPSSGGQPVPPAPPPQPAGYPPPPANGQTGASTGQLINGQRMYWNGNAWQATPGQNYQNNNPNAQSWQSANPGQGNIPPELIQMLMNRFGGGGGGLASLWGNMLSGQ